MTWQRCLDLDLDVSDAWGNWLAGFVAGEGCFIIDTSANRVKCTLEIELRADDTHILKTIQSTLGIGSIEHLKPRPSNRRPNSQTRWVVRRIGDLIHVIIPLFQKYPLRAKKQYDFEIWARAVRMVHIGHHNNKTGREEIIKLKRQLELVRKYNGTPTNSTETNP